MILCPIHWPRWENRQTQKYFKDGSFSKGDYFDGKKTGWWITINENGDEEEGEYQNGEKTGVWETSYMNGEKERNDFGKPKVEKWVDDIYYEPVLKRA